jgi:hypothetical protein
MLDLYADAQRWMIAGIISFVRPDIAGVMSESGRTRKSEWLPWHAEGREAYWPVVGYGVAYMQSSRQPCLSSEQ